MVLCSHKFQLCVVVFCSASTCKGMVSGPVLYQTKLNYTDPKYATATVAGEVRPGTNYRSDCIPCNVSMRNGREVNGKSAKHLIDTMGFAVATFSDSEHSLISRVRATDIETDKEQRSTYFHALEKIVMRVYGGDYVRAFNFVLRHSDCLGVHTRPVGDNAPRGPVNDIHADFTPDAPAIQQISSLGEAIGLKDCRWAIINCWRNISQTPVQQWPMAVCDATSVRVEDCVARLTPENGNLVYGMLPNGDRHQWYTFPELRENEVLMFKQYDSSSCFSRFTQHTSFNAPHPVMNPETRRSTEVRVLCYFIDDDRRNSESIRMEVANGKGVVAASIGRFKSRL